MLLFVGSVNHGSQVRPSLLGTCNDQGAGLAYALLGPSGCGKTTLLNIISGLVIPSQGRLLFDDADVTHLATKERNIAQVFQFPVIYDTMTVAENLAFPLKNRRLAKAAVDRRVAEIAAMPDLTGVLNRRARGLTADAKQKISLGRGLVRSDVSAVLFDEPLTVIDPALKWELRSKLKAVHRALDLLMIYVTHDQIEALTFADKVVVMNEGKAGEGDRGLPNGRPVDEWGIRAENNIPVGASISRGGGANSPAAVYACAKFVEWLKKYAPPEAAGMDFLEAGAVPGQGHIAQQVFWYSAFTHALTQPNLPVMNADGTPKWRMAPSPRGLRSPARRASLDRR